MRDGDKKSSKWKNMHFVVSGPHFYWFKDKKDNKHKKKAKGSISCIGAKISKADPGETQGMDVLFFFFGIRIFFFPKKRLFWNRNLTDLITNFLLRCFYFLFPTSKYRKCFSNNTSTQPNPYPSCTPTRREKW